MPPREDLILFLDLETTGTDEKLDDIIEVGLSLVDATKDDYPEIDSYSCVINPRDSAFVRMMDKRVVREMHEANGLMETILNFRETGMGAFGAPSYAEADILKWLDVHRKGDDTHIPLAGSGVLHFDRRFIKQWLPWFDRTLTHWAYDMGVFRRSFQKAGVQPYSQEAKTHRALDDARVHADEWRFYQEFIRG